MSTISNKFFIQVLEDGSTLHGQLLATITPTQSYKDGTFIPDWATNEAARPLIYLSLQNGATDVAPDSGYSWSYNGVEISFSSSSTTKTIGSTSYTGYVDTNFGEKFFKTTYNGMPALGIIGNLASSSNVDIDVIRFDGTKTLSTNPVSFSCMLNVTITQWTSGGYLGVLTFPQGNVIKQANQSLICSAVLYNDSGVVNVTAANYRWYREGVDTTIASPWKTGQTITITESDVTDYLVIRCDIYVVIDGTTTLVYSAYGSIDDQQDPEYMWIKYNGANGNSASLRSGESVTFSICVGTAEDDTPKTAWTVFKVKFLDSEGNIVTSTSGAASDSAFRITPSDGFRTLSTSSGVATAKIYYNDVVNLCKKGLTGIVIASTSA